MGFFKTMARRRYHSAHFSEKVIVNSSADADHHGLAFQELLDLADHLRAPRPAAVLTKRATFFKCAKSCCCHRPLCQPGTHQHVVLHHVFGVKGVNGGLSGLQLRQVALHAAVHSRRLRAGRKGSQKPSKRSEACWRGGFTHVV